MESEKKRPIVKVRPEHTKIYLQRRDLLLRHLAQLDNSCYTKGKMCLWHKGKCVICLCEQWWWF